MFSKEQHTKKFQINFLVLSAKIQSAKGGKLCQEEEQQIKTSVKDVAETKPPSIQAKKSPKYETKNSLVEPLSTNSLSQSTNLGNRNVPKLATAEYSRSRKRSFENEGSDSQESEPKRQHSERRKEREVVAEGGMTE